jgi:hypothetical protein
MSRNNRDMSLCSIRVGKNHIGYIKWLLEAHSGMATPTTREGTQDVIDLLVAPGFEDEFKEFLKALGHEIAVENVDPPNKPPLGA